MKKIYYKGSQDASMIASFLVIMISIACIGVGGESLIFAMIGIPMAIINFLRLGKEYDELIKEAVVSTEIKGLPNPYQAKKDKKSEKK